MALLQNGYRDRSSGVRIFGATISNSAYPYALQANSALTGTKRNIVASEAWTDEQIGLPHGYRSGYTWLLPQKNGAAKSANESEGLASTTFSIAGGKNGASTIEGVGSFTATGALVVSGTASISGLATVTSNAFAALLATATISGSGGIATANDDAVLREDGGFVLREDGGKVLLESSYAGATLTALGWGVVSISGVATFTGERYATGELEAEITPFTELSPQSLASAVWAEALEAGYTAAEIMRVMSAALAGEVSGAGTAIVTIRDIADTTDRIVASVDGTGNRTAVTLDTN